MLDWLDAVPGLAPCSFSGVPGVLGVPEPANPQKTVGLSGTPAGNTTSAPVFCGVPADQAEKPGNPPVVRPEHSEHAEHVPENRAKAILREWHANLSKLDTFIPPAGFSAGRWTDLCDDACWLYETHASQLVREGWSALDVFGVSQRRENGEVLLDRLRGARNLRLDGQGRATWEAFGVVFITSRGAAPAGMRAVWEVGLQEQAQSGSGSV